MKNITIRQMRTFESVSRHLNFSRAAEDLHLTQPAVSMQIKQMEEQTAQPLLIHKGKRILLTDAGELILHHCKVILADLSAAEASFEEHTNDKNQLLRVGLITSGSYTFPQMIHTFVKNSTNVKLHMTVRSRDQLIPLLRNKEIDVAVMIRDLHQSDFIATPFARIPFVVVASPTHPLIGEANIPLSRIASECMILREPGTDTRNVVDEFFSQPHAKPPFMELSCEEAIKRSVTAGLGVSILSAQAVSSEVSSGNLCILDVEGFPLERSWRVVIRANGDLPPAAREFREFLLTEGGKTVTHRSNSDNASSGSRSQPQQQNYPFQTTTTTVAPDPMLHVARRTRELVKLGLLAEHRPISGPAHATQDDYSVGRHVPSGDSPHH